MSYLLKMLAGVTAFIMIGMFVTFGLEYILDVTDHTPPVDHSNHYDDGYEKAMFYYETGDDLYIRIGCDCDDWQRGFDDCIKMKENENK